ncbi:DUF4238 domain-containing protein [Fibrella forsythiae]|uniref:DUF4238 domain-containing protein n=1 Tax=Fibrella forsythiae TaxID=2817061 RepID=A0ABS3JVQ7_9BACT|nr:DUF4238 domain-containing protein [Fibrella forsythiae]MBO0953264.1 DUF4238 domain-containing protein [Fibrella forsythiae]
MSTPKNHHYVSQCHIKKFFNEAESRIFMYDKAKANFYSSRSTKNIFSDKYGNSRYDNGEIDHSTLETELSDYFETEFAENCELIEHAVINLTIDAIEPLVKLTKFGILSELRHPSFKKRNDDTLLSTFKSLRPNSSPEFTKELDKLISVFDKTKFLNIGSYKELADKIFLRMGNAVYTIIKIENDEHFILADNYGVIKRSNLAKNSLARIVTGVSFPLTSKLFLHVDSENVELSNVKIKKISDHKNRGFSEIINKEIFDNAIKTIACESEAYLKKFIANLHDSQ